MRVQLGRQLLDRQIVDRDGRLVGKVDDLAFAFDDEGYPYVDCLLTGQGALGQRVGGLTGRFLLALADRFVESPPVRPVPIPFSLVERVDSAVRLRCRSADLPPSAVENWLRRNVIERIPGAHRASG